MGEGAAGGRVGRRSAAARGACKAMDKYQRLEDYERRARLGGGEARLKRQHAAGKLTAHERSDLFFDPGTFQEIDKLYSSEGVDEMFTEIMLDNFDYDRGEE